MNTHTHTDKRNTETNRRLTGKRTKGRSRTHKAFNKVFIS